MSNKLLFSIGGTMLSNYGVQVETCSGLLHIPKRKTQISNNDAQSHGTFYDINATPKYEERNLILNCFIIAQSRGELFSKINAVRSIFDGVGYNRLTAEIGNDIKLPFEVIRDNGGNIEPNWESSKALARFQLKFIEPFPVKRVIKSNGGSVFITFTTTKLITIGWGNGTYSYDLIGTVSVSKTLTSGTQIVIMGDIEEITNFNLTGGTVQWDIYA